MPARVILNPQSLPASLPTMQSPGKRTPARRVVRQGLTPEAAKGKSIDELLATMTGKKK